MTGAFRAALFVTLAFATGACETMPARSAVLPRLVLEAADGTKHDVAEETRSARLTVLFFSGWSCPCQTVHDARIRDIYARYHPLGVEVFAIDSEASGGAARDKAEAGRRGYAFPVLLDAGGALARAVGAEYATESFVLDRAGVVRYHGGIDSDRKELHGDAEPYLRDALDDLFAGRSVRTAESKALGCALQMW